MELVMLVCILRCSLCELSAEFGYGGLPAQRSAQ